MTARDMEALPRVPQRIGTGPVEPQVSKQREKGPSELMTLESGKPGYRECQSPTWEATRAEFQSSLVPQFSHL